MLADTWKWIVGGAAVGLVAALLVHGLGGATGADGVHVERSTSASGRGEDDDTIASEVLAAADSDAVQRAPTEFAPLGSDGVATATLIGRVVDESGAPVANAAVELTDADTRATYSATGTGGTWSMFDVAPAPYTLKVSANGYVDAEESVVVPRLAAVQHSTVLRRALEIPLRIEDSEGQLLVFGRDEPSIADHVGVVVMRERPGATTSARGPHTGGECARLLLRNGSGANFLPPDLGERYCGMLVLTAAPPLWVALTLGDGVVESRALVGDETELAFTLDAARIDTLRGRVRVQIVAERSAELLTERCHLEPFGSLNDLHPVVDGEALLFDDVPPGEHLLACRAPGVESLEFTFRLLPGEELDLGTIVLAPPAKFDVLTLDENGAPLSTNVEVQSARLVLDPRATLVPVYEDTSDEGRLTINRHAAGVVQVVAGGRRGRARVGRVVDTAQEDPIVLRVPTGSDVKFVADEVTRRLRFTVADASGVELFSYLPLATCLAPGAYSFTARDVAGNVLHEGAFEVAAGTTTVRIEVPR